MSFDAAKPIDIPMVRRRVSFSMPNDGSASSIVVEEEGRAGSWSGEMTVKVKMVSSGEFHASIMDHSSVGRVSEVAAPVLARQSSGGSSKDSRIPTLKCRDRGASYSSSSSAQSPLISQQKRESLSLPNSPVFEKNLSRPFKITEPQRGVISVAVSPPLQLPLSSIIEETHKDVSAEEKTKQVARQALERRLGEWLKRRHSHDQLAPVSFRGAGMDSSSAALKAPSGSSLDFRPRSVSDGDV